jgi:VanZ family protein
LPRSPLTATKAAIALSVFAIIAITLTPIGNGPPLPFSPSIGEGRRWLADGLLNLVLFVPLGLALGWNGRSVAKVALAGLLLSTAVEIAQLWIPGRDSSLSDIVFNTGGTLVGALLGRGHRAWIVPRPETSRALTGTTLAIAALAMVLTAFLLSPREQALSLTRSGSDIVLSYPARADSVGLDAPVYWLSVRGSNIAAPLSVGRDRARWYVSVGSRRFDPIGPTVGHGWALLGYPDAIGRRWSAELSAIWLMALCALIGYSAVGRVPVFGALGGIALLLAVIPEIFGIVRTPFIEWVAAYLGFAAAAGLRVLAQRLGRSASDQ